VPSQYLIGTDLATYGVPGANSGQVVQASALIDAYLKRPEGLIWSPDSQGNPAYMSSMSPLLSATLTSNLSPGAMVQATLSNNAKNLQPGDVLVLDRANAELVETVVIQTISLPNTTPVTVTFQQVLNSHSMNATADYGLVIEEKKYMPKDRPQTRVSRTPTMCILSGVGRYAYGRRGDAANYNMGDWNLLAALSKFGGPPYWEVFQATYPPAWDMTTGEVWIPAGIMLAYYSEIKLRYIAGFQASALPGCVKEATAAIVSALQATPGMGNVKKVQAGDTSIENFAASVLSADTKAALTPYGARAFT
jgi:hypothetical protein